MRSITFQGQPKKAAPAPAKQQQKPMLDLPPVQKQELKNSNEQPSDSFVRFGCSSC